MERNAIVNPKPWSLERMTAFLRRCHVNPNGYGEAITYTDAEIAAFVAEDKEQNWPAIESARRNNVA